VFTLEAADEGRLDRALLRRLEGFTRAAIQRLIRRGSVLLNGSPARASARVRAGDRLDVEVPRVLPPSVDPEDLPLRVLVERDGFVVLDKAPGMPVHPGRGRLQGTLANAIAHRYGALSTVAGVYRPGIVHRLDLDTSGAIVIARTEAAHARLADAFRARAVTKEYRAIVLGEPSFDEERVEAALGRDPRNPKRMAVRAVGGRGATTDVKVLERFGVAAHVRCVPRTGRTHQIRVHLAHRGHPILGDAVYARGRPAPLPVPRLMLHAHRLGFPDPETGERIEAEAPLPEDFLAALAALRAIDRARDAD